ncbi:hypothetical protein GOV11_04350, partial [Candidatus Woesearchaeota archaeon]|nr:hypothetical protein [Candidatus Woesearchaeota archaeon]
IFLSLAVAFEVLVPTAAALLIAAVVAYLKAFRNNPIIHNFSELFMYAGIVILLGPLFDLLWVSLLLLAISVYDMIAVWQSKHMVKLAKAQTEAQMFAGLYIPKSNPSKKSITAPSAPKKSIPSAILGGGDIAFPLLFSAVVLGWLIESNVAPMTAFYQTLIITVFSTIALSLLFAYSKKDRFYPAMPFLSAGCFLGLGIIILITI